MQQFFRKILMPPVFPKDEDKTRSARILNTIGWSTLLVTVAILLIRTIQGNDLNLTEVNGVLIAIIAIITSVLYVSHRGYVRSASFLFVVTLWGALSYVA